MREFKFACPVCGQHITSGAESSGEHIDCPTCFQKLVVPQAPASEDTKLILSAKKVSKVRFTQAELPGLEAPHRTQRVWSFSALALLLLSVGAAGFFYLRAHRAAQPEKPAPGPEASVPEVDPNWTLDVEQASIREEPASGLVHGQPFIHSSAILQGGKLTLAQGESWPPDLGISISFLVQDSARLFGKSLQVTPERAPPLPKVVLRWKNQERQGVNHTLDSGYALSLAFGKPHEGKIPGRLYLACPDAQHSFVSGTFEAEIRARGGKGREPSQTGTNLLSTNVPAISRP